MSSIHAVLHGVLRGDYGSLAILLTGKGHRMPSFANFLSCLLLAEGDATGPGPSMLSGMLPILMIIVLFYMLMIRPERRKKAELLEMLQNLKKNDRVVTIGGIYGTVISTSKDSEEVTIKIDENTNTKLKMQRSAIARVLNGDTGSPTKGGS